MKLNWGTGIAIFYIVFVLFTGFMVYKAFGEDFDLVTEDYYAQEIKFQDKIDSRTRAEKLDASLQSVVDGKNLKIIFPQQEEALSGSINCFRPSDETKDFTESFETANGFHTIPLNKFIKGKYLIKVDWSANDIEYYQEQTIIIP
jgi:hypothetical protein